MASLLIWQDKECNVTDMSERVARLEQHVETIDDQMLAIEERANKKMDKIEHSVGEIHVATDKICNKLSRFEGKVGGILLMATLIWSGAMMFKDSIVHWVSSL